MEDLFDPIVPSAAPNLVVALVTTTVGVGSMLVGTVVLGGILSVVGLVNRTVSGVPSR